MGISRRGLGRAAALGAAAAATARSTAEAATARRVATLAHVVRRGRPGRKGYATLVRGAGEAHVVRTDLGVKARPGRARRRRGVIAFAQISDVHIVDAQSPLRVEWTDRFDDPSPLAVATGIFTSAYRPHEMLSAHVADAMVREINAIGRGPGHRPQAGAGDPDRRQLRQLAAQRGPLEHRPPRRRHGARRLRRPHDGTRACATTTPTSYDRAYWHPHRPPPGKRRRRRQDDVRLPDRAGPARRGPAPVPRAGVSRCRGTPCFGNHDGLVQGNFPAETLQLNAIATGPLKIISPPAGFDPAAIGNALAERQHRQHCSRRWS